MFFSHIVPHTRAVCPCVQKYNFGRTGTFVFAILICLLSSVDRNNITTTHITTDARTATCYTRELTEQTNKYK